MSGAQSKSLRRLSQARHQFLIPAIEDSNATAQSRETTLINYLIKMKSDTSHFGQLDIGKYFNFCEKTRSDPFLITTGLN